MNPKNKNTSFIWIILAFVFGMVIGLVVLGWWLWPVQWQGASFDLLSFSDQQSFLRMAVEAFAYNPDGGLAQERYNALGEQKERVLSEILINPGYLPKTEIERFANVVQAQLVTILPTAVIAPSATTAETEAPAAPSVLSALANRPGWVNILLPVACGLLIILIILLILASRRRRKSTRTKSIGTEVDDDNTQTPFDVTEEAYPAVNQTSGSVSQPISPAESELPDWLSEVTKEPVAATAESKSKTHLMEFSDSDIAAISNSNFASPEIQPNTPAAENDFLPILPPDGEGIPTEAEFPEMFDESGSQAEGSQPESIPTGQAETFDETKEETFTKFSRDIALTPGVSFDEANKLRAGGVTAPLLLLRKGATLKGRQTIAMATGLTETQILRWANFIDLLRIKGLSIADAQILKATGVDLLVELATREPGVLLEKIRATAQSSDPSYRIPSRARVENWISQARALPRIITYT